jgi:hypothetical protein
MAIEMPFDVRRDLAKQIAGLVSRRGHDDRDFVHDAAHQTHGGRTTHAAPIDVDTSARVIAELRADLLQNVSAKTREAFRRHGRDRLIEPSGRLAQCFDRGHDGED